MLIKNVMDDYKDLDVFKIFCADFLNAWEREKRNRKSFVNYHGYFIDVQGNGDINICLQSKVSVVAIFKKQKSWIDDVLLYEKMIQLLPEYEQYFKNKRNLVFTKGWENVIFSGQN